MNLEEILSKLGITLADLNTAIFSDVSGREQLRKTLLETSGDGAEMLKSCAKAMKYETPDEIQGLKSALERQKDENRTLKEKTVDVEKSEMYIKLKADLEEARKTAGSAETFSQIKKTLESEYNSKIKEVDDKLNLYKGRYLKTLVDDQLNTILDDVGIKKPHNKLAVKALLEKRIVTSENGDNVLISMRGDGDVEVPLKDGVMLYAKGEGKPFVDPLTTTATNFGSGSGRFNSTNNKADGLGIAESLAQKYNN